MYTVYNLNSPVSSPCFAATVCLNIFTNGIIFDPDTVSSALSLTVAAFRLPRISMHCAIEAYVTAVKGTTSRNAESCINTS